MFTSFKKLLLGTLLVFMTVDLGVCSEAYSGNNIIEIHTADDLIKLAEQSNLSEGADNFTGKTVRFMNDIDMKNKPFDGISTGDEFKMFRGRLDGNHKTIKGLKIDKPSISSVGLIGQLGDLGLVENLTIAKGSTIKGRTITGRTSVGAFVGRVADNATVTIKGVTNHATVTGTDRSAGGLVGYSNGALTIANSSNIGAVTGDQGVGGLVGYSHGALEIANSLNIGTVTGAGNVGGLVGFNGEGSNGALTINNSSNTGDIEGAMGVGGLVGGFVGSGSSTNFTISNSSNIGNVKGYSEVGGLVGWSYDTTSTISNSSNTGAVEGEGEDVGGLVGYSRGALTIDNSLNTGVVEITRGTGAGKSVGGLVGLSESGSTLTIDNSSNIGNVKGFYHVGGLVGNSNATATITNSHSYAKIVTGSSKVDGIGGIVGMINSGTFTATNVYWLYEAEGTGIELAVGEIGKGDYNPNNTSNLDKRAFKKKGSFKGWDIKKVWELKKGADYPTLKNLVIPVVTP